MLNERLAAAQKIRAAFLDAERLADQAATETAACVAEMLRLRTEARLPVTIGLDALAQVSKASALMVEARKLIIDAHADMARLPCEIGLPPLAAGDISECPPLDPPRNRLDTIVAIAA